MFVDFKSDQECAVHSLLTVWQHVCCEDSGVQNLLVIAEIQSIQSIQEEEIRNRLDELTLDEAICCFVCSPQSKGLKLFTTITTWKERPPSLSRWILWSISSQLPTPTTLHKLCGCRVVKMLQTWTYLDRIKSGRWTFTPLRGKTCTHTRGKEYKPTRMPCQKSHMLSVQFLCTMRHFLWWQTWKSSKETLSRLFGGSAYKNMAFAVGKHEHKKHLEQFGFPRFHNRRMQLFWTQFMQFSGPSSASARGCCTLQRFSKIAKISSPELKLTCCWCRLDRHALLHLVWVELLQAS